MTGTEFQSLILAAAIYGTAAWGVSLAIENAVPETPVQPGREQLTVALSRFVQSGSAAAENPRPEEARQESEKNSEPQSRAETPKVQEAPKVKPENVPQSDVKKPKPESKKPRPETRARAEQKPAPQKPRAAEQKSTKKGAEQTDRRTDKAREAAKQPAGAQKGSGSAAALSAPAQAAAPGPEDLVFGRDSDPRLVQVKRALQNALRYPARAMDRGLEGRVIVEFTIEPSGALSSLRIKQSQAATLLQQNALETVKAAARDFPKTSRPLHITIPVEYRLDN